MQCRFFYKLFLIPCMIGQKLAYLFNNVPELYMPKPNILIFHRRIVETQEEKMMSSSDVTW